MRRSLTRERRIRKTGEFRSLYKNGERVSCFGLKLFYTENSLGFSRVGFSLVRKYGNAVERNRAKRIAKEIYREYESRLSGGFDMLFLLYRQKDSYAERKRQFETVLKRKGFFEE